MIPANTRIWIVAGVTDMRRGLMSLSGLVQTALDQNPLTGNVYVFKGAQRRPCEDPFPRRRGSLSVPEEAGPRPICLATGGERNDFPYSSAAFDAVRGNRLAPSGAYVCSVHGDVNRVASYPLSY
jgi:IS66 Orf2 like protein